MGDKTEIPWCHATFNPWWGCVEVSPGCDFCYARTLAKRYGHAVWGKDAPRRFFGDKHWDEPLRWNRAAEAAGERRRVFCASMADVLEERDDAVGHELDQLRLRLWFVIANTPALDWLLLTKRPSGFRRLVPKEILALKNVWPGATVESQDYAWRLEELLRLNCAGPRWVSYEPALAWVDYRWYFARSSQSEHAKASLRWVIVGGESGPGARPFDARWARLFIRQCRDAGVAPFMKQIGSLAFDSDRPPGGWCAETQIRTRDRKGEDPAEWPEDLRVREFPE